MRSSPLLACFCLIASVGVGCRGGSGPSADYARASKLWLTTVEEVGDGAGTDPRAEEALALARTVPADSIDADAARALVKRIEEAKAEAKTSITPGKDQPAQATEARYAPEEDPEPAPARPARPPLVGSSEEDFKARYGACVELEGPFLEAGGTRTGDAWRLVPSPACQEAHPEIADLLVFILESRVFNVAPRSALKTVVRTDAGWQPEEAPPSDAPPADGR